MNSFGIFPLLPFRPIDFLAALLLGAGLVLPPVASYEAVYVTATAALILAGIGLTRDRSVLLLPGVRLVALATAMIVVATVLAGPVASDWAGPGIVALVLLSLGVSGAAVLSPHLITPVTIAGCCLAGSLAGAGLGAWEMIASGSRAGAGNNPIHYSGLVVILGFCALPGVLNVRSAWRYVFLLGPIAAFVAAVAAGSRGPLLAALVLSFIAWTMFLVWHRRSGGFWALSFMLGAAGAISLSIFGDEARAFAGLVGTLTGDNSATSNSDDIRQTLYWGGFNAFLDSPLWGHGFSNLMAAASEHIPAERRYTRFDHLHNDLIDFLVVGGILGGLSYLSLLAAPLTVIRHRGRREARSTILMAVMLAGSYALLGLTNAMIGILPQTVLFAVLFGCVLVFDQQLERPAQQSND